MATAITRSGMLYLYFEILETPYCLVSTCLSDIRTWVPGAIRHSRTAYRDILQADSQQGVTNVRFSAVRRGKAIRPTV